MRRLLIAMAVAAALCWLAADSFNAQTTATSPTAAATGPATAPASTGRNGSFERDRQLIADLLAVTGDGPLLDRKRHEQVAQQKKDDITKAIAKLYEARRGQDAQAQAERDMEGPPVMVTFRQLQLAQGRWAVSSNSMSEGQTSVSFIGAIEARLTSAGDRLDITLSDRLVPRRLEVHDDGDGGFWLMLTDLKGGSMIALQRRSDGSVSAACSDGQGDAAASEKTWQDFCRKHRAWADGRIFEPLQEVGVAFGKLPGAEAQGAATTAPAPAAAQLGPIDRSAGLMPDLAKDVGRLAGLSLGARGLAINRAQWGTNIPADSDRVKEIAKNELGSSLSASVRAAATDARIALQLLEDAVDHLGTSSGGWGSSGSGGQTYSRSFGKSGVFKAGFDIDGDKTSLMLGELKGIRRTINISDNGSGNFELRLADDTGRLLMITQRPGSFAAAEFGPQAAFAGRETSYMRFCAKYPQYSRRVMEQLEFLGLTVPPSPYSPAVKGAVAARLAELTPQDQRAARKLIADLDDDSPKVREAATQALIAGFARYEPLMTQARAKADMSPEAKLRLERVYARNANHAKVLAIIDAFGLDKNAAYLTDLLKDTKPAPQPDSLRQAILTRLEELKAATQPTTQP